MNIDAKRLFVIGALGLAACSAAPEPAPAVVVAPAADPTVHVAVLDPATVALEPAPRPGSARRFLKLPQADSQAAPVRTAIDVPAAWGIRVREAGGRALRPCQVSPSSPSELFVMARPACDSIGCAEHEKLADDLVRARLITAGDIESRASENLGPAARVTRLSGTLGGRPFSAFRFVNVDPQTFVPVACEAFLYGDETALDAAYEAACATVRIAPADFQDGPDELPAAPDGKALSLAEEAVIHSAVGYVSALSGRDSRTAASFLLTTAECTGSGGSVEDCEAGAETRIADLPRAVESIPAEMVPGAADVRFPTSLQGLAIATVKRRGDPCGPGYEVTLARVEKRYAVVAAEPIPDPRLASSGR